MEYTNSPLLKERCPIGRGVRQIKQKTKSHKYENQTTHAHQRNRNL